MYIYDHRRATKYSNWLSFGRQVNDRIRHQMCKFWFDYEKELFAFRLKGSRRIDSRQTPSFVTKTRKTTKPLSWTQFCLRFVRISPLSELVVLESQWESSNFKVEDKSLHALTLLRHHLGNHYIVNQLPSIVENAFIFWSIHWTWTWTWIMNITNFLMGHCVYPLHTWGCCNWSLADEMEKSS